MLFVLEFAWRKGGRKNGLNVEYGVPSVKAMKKLSEVRFAPAAARNHGRKPYAPLPALKTLEE